MTTKTQDALNTAIFIAAYFGKLGFHVQPVFKDDDTDQKSWLFFQHPTEFYNIASHEVGTNMLAISGDISTDDNYRLLGFAQCHNLQTEEVFWEGSPTYDDMTKRRA